MKKSHIILDRAESLKVKMDNTTTTFSLSTIEPFLQHKDDEGSHDIYVDNGAFNVYNNDLKSLRIFIEKISCNKPLYFPLDIFMHWLYILIHFTSFFSYLILFFMVYKNRFSPTRFS
jgi:hypothetical protein